MTACLLRFLPAFSASGTSTQPVKRFSAFQTDCPCRINTSFAVIGCNFRQLKKVGEGAVNNRARALIIVLFMEWLDGRVDQPKASLNALNVFPDRV